MLTYPRRSRTEGRRFSHATKMLMRARARATQSICPVTGDSFPPSDRSPSSMRNSPASPSDATLVKA
jgi:hypothetical protein